MRIDKNKLTISPKTRHIDATIAVPGSKSITNRALIIASLAEGASVLKNISLCDDSLFMLEALKELGIKIKKISANNVRITGTAGRLKVPKRSLYVDNAGTTMRFLCSFVTFANGVIVLRGDSRMSERPMNDLLYSLHQMGIEAEKKGADIKIKSFGFFPGGAVNLSGKKSSQFISSLLMCAPYGKDNFTLNIQDEIVSKPYLDITLKMMTDFGAKVEARNNYRKISVSNKHRYAPKEYTIEGDASGASYFWAAAAITKGRVRVTNINPETKQGDIGFLDILRRMGCKIRYGDDLIELAGGNLKGLNVDMNSMPDVVPTLAIAALFAKGRTTIRNVAHLRGKESDRLAQVANELSKAGAKIRQLKDGLIIVPDIKSLHSAVLDSHNDHRLSMSFSLLGLKMSVTIKNPMCVRKSFPEFFDRFKQLVNIK